MTTLPKPLISCFNALAVLGTLCMLNGCASYKLGSAAELVDAIVPEPVDDEEEDVAEGRLGSGDQDWGSFVDIST